VIRAFATFCVLVSTPAFAAERPNFVILMTDDQRADALGCAGNPILRTPNLDRLAAEGMRFTNAFVTNALCAPSRATLLTGMYSHAHGVVDNNNRPIRPDQPLLSDLLRNAGYEVAFCGKSHVAGALRDRAWDYYFGYKGQGDYLKPVIAEGVDGTDQPYTGYMDDVVTDHALEWLRRKRERPFCLFLWFKAPHRSWQRARRHHDLFIDAVIPKPETYDDDLAGYPGKPRAFAEADNKIGDSTDVRSLDFVKDYYATITAVDENVGRILAALGETAALDDTAVLFTSDNGFFHGEWRLYDKRLMHEPSIRVPFLVRYPPLVKPGGQCPRMALNIDIAPTVLDLAGVTPPAWMQGRSLRPLLAGQETAWRQDWLYEYFEYPGVHSVRKHRGVRTERYKLIHYYEPPQEFELYDLQTDPGERHNLYGQAEHAALAARLLARIDELRRETGDQ
jgi:arylsulfatase A-like enzyme